MPMPSAPTILAIVVLAGALPGCTLLTAAPPQIEVQRVELTGAGPLQQSLAVTLCVTNPNDAALDVRRVRVAVDVAGAPLADADSVVPVRLPPHASTPVPFAVATTVLNLGPQLGGVLRSGGLDYRIHGTVQLDGALAVTLPFSRSGRLDPLAAGTLLLADAAVPAGTRCGTAP